MIHLRKDFDVTWCSQWCGPSGVHGEYVLDLATCPACLARLAEQGVAAADRLHRLALAQQT